VISNHYLFDLELDGYGHITVLALILMVIFCWDFLRIMSIVMHSQSMADLKNEIFTVTENTGTDILRWTVQSFLMHIYHVAEVDSGCIEYQHHNSCLSCHRSWVTFIM
jgi:hypothetical protein